MKLITAVAASTLLALVACASSASTKTSTVAPPRGTIIFGQGNPGPIFAIAPDGTHQREIHAASCCPRMSPDGSRMVVTDFGTGEPKAATLRLDGSAYTVLHVPDPTLLLTDPWAFSPDGATIAGEGGNGADNAGPQEGIYTFRLPLGAGLARVDASPGLREFPIAFSPDGSKILFVRQLQHGQPFDGPETLFVVKTDGTGLVQLNPPGTTSGLIDGPLISTATWSPDGREVAFIAAEGSFWTSDRAVFVVESSGANPRRITPWGNTYGAMWSPNGKWIAFASDTGGTDLFVVHPDGTGLKALTSAAGGLFALGPAWSPDSGELLFVRSKTDLNSTDLWTVNVDGSNLSQLTHSPGLYNSYTWIP
jgi:dipeptidyl aminopeptidase/acylaminoacyl peptidase